MTVNFYTITDAANVVSKTLSSDTLQAIQNVDIYKPSSLDAPRLILGAFTNMMAKNYCYIEKFGRYYFITNITVTSAQRVIMDLQVDVLFTYAASIKECIGTAIRSESAGINKISDSKYPVNTCRYVLDVINYSRTPFTRNPSSPYILTTIGGDTT